MNHPTLSIVRSKTAFELPNNILDAFVEQLHFVGCSDSFVCVQRREARHFLTWLGLCGIEVETIDDAVLCAFRRHDCHCPGMEGERHKMLTLSKRHFMTGAWKLVDFMEDQGCVPHHGELNVNLRHLDGFLAQCRADGYSSSILQLYRCSCQHILIWLHRSRLSVMDVDAETLKLFLHHDCVCSGAFKRPHRRKNSIRYDSPFRSFLQYLGTTGTLPIQSLTPEPQSKLSMAPFAAWLRRHRGVSERTIHIRSRHAAMLIAKLGPDSRLYDAAGIREVLLRHYASVSTSEAANLASSMRMYLRYLATTGKCSPFLVDAVPTATTWRLASLPRYINPEQVEHVIACCDVTTPVGLRNRAILLLLARLALRASDIVALQLKDIDWRNALVRVCGKSKRQDALPLPQDVGDAILAYIETARPRVAENSVFLKARAPHRPFASGGAVTEIVVSALKRADLGEMRPRGAHLFRHSAATNMLRSGQSLETISALLRHKSMDTTAIYAKTDKSMLLEVAQPWIGGQS